ncbi:MAG: FGGY-family carbohydrate kinase [Alphaproteobacteria bacterium]
MAVDAPLLVGVDVGTSRVRSLIFDVDGHVRAQAATPTPLNTTTHGWAEHDPQALWQAVLRTLGEAMAALPAGTPIAGIAVASVGESGVPLDDKGEPVHPVIAWYDHRSETQAAQVAKTIGRDRIFQTTGLAIDPTCGLFKLLWLKDNATDAFARTTSWLNVADWIAFQLCGVQATDYGLASRTLALDLRHHHWSEDLLALADIDPNLLAPLHASGTALGPVRDHIATQVGLPKGVIVGVGGHDHICGAVAQGVVRPGMLLDSMGTAEALFRPTQEPRFDSQTRDLAYLQGAITATTGYLMGGVYTSGGAVEWFRETIAGGKAHATLIDEAAEIPPGANGTMFLPHLRYASSAASRDPARGAFLGLAADTGRGTMFRALLEGLAFEARLVVDAMAALPDMAALQEIRVTGGNTQNALLLAIKASVFGQPLHVSKVQESTSLGAAIFGGIAAGIYRNVDHALEHTSRPPHIIEPNPAWNEHYAELYDYAYRHLADTLRETNRRLYSLAGAG